MNYLNDDGFDFYVNIGPTQFTLDMFKVIIKSSLVFSQNYLIIILYVTFFLRNNILLQKSPFLLKIFKNVGERHYWKSKGQYQSSFMEVKCAYWQVKMKAGSRVQMNFLGQWKNAQWSILTLSQWWCKERVKHL